MFCGRAVQEGGVRLAPGEMRGIRPMRGARLSANIGPMRITDIFKGLMGPLQSVPTSADVTLRRARDEDAQALAELAQLDSSRTPGGAVLVAEVAGELWAAVSLDDGHAVATPFRPSGELTFRLVERARELNRTARRTPGPAVAIRPLGGTR
jgi:hypothetical protein